MMEKKYSIKEIEEILERIRKSKPHVYCLCGHFESCPNCDDHERMENSRVINQLKRYENTGDFK